MHFRPFKRYTTHLNFSAQSYAYSGRDRIQQQQAEVNEVVGIMKDNVARVLERDQRLSDLDHRAEVDYLWLLIRQKGPVRWKRGGVRSATGSAKLGGKNSIMVAGCEAGLGMRLCPCAELDLWCGCRNVRGRAFYEGEGEPANGLMTRLRCVKFREEYLQEKQKRCLEELKELSKCQQFKFTPPPSHTYLKLYPNVVVKKKKERPKSMVR
ncbi:unnamed protein product [Hydatigera taeniaeformis]|uniref:V-SNARE coiled-coil homology domain-containing protein n=1 Tax=Hydatigena taeniaeformis TaxID=6205 RepID=A0A0R3WIV9_HYDTA|nr:unnamed protein product [Hydatigera taeniaeformis]